MSTTHLKSFGIIGGDKRQAAMAESIFEDGHTVYVCGFDGVSFTEGIQKADINKTVKKCENIILPLPTTNDGIYLKTDFSHNKIKLDDDFAKKFQRKWVFGGMTKKLRDTSRLWNDIKLFDYYKREEFAVENAVPTAEGAIETAMREYDGTIHGSKCLIVGFGRIGKTLASMIHGIGADVTVSARKTSDISWIKTYGYKPVSTCDICKGSQYDIVFNTVPALVFDKKLLERVTKKTLIIDLASLPGGVDFNAAAETGIKTIHALSLPGKVAPKTAGAIIKNVVYNIINEEEERPI